MKINELNYNFKFIRTMRLNVEYQNHPPILIEVEGKMTIEDVVVLISVQSMYVHYDRILLKYNGKPLPLKNSVL